MGQAKLRGSFEERRTQAIKRIADEHVARRAREEAERDAEAERIAALPEEERAAILAERRQMRLQLQRLGMTAFLARALAGPSIVKGKDKL